MEIILLIGRILFGGYFLMMGITHFAKNPMLAQYAASKGVPSSRLAVYVSGLLILFGGLGVILGIYVETALILIMLFLVPVSFMMHAFWSEKDPAMKMADMTNFLKNIALLGAALVIFAEYSGW